MTCDVVKIHRMDGTESKQARCIDTLRQMSWSTRSRRGRNVLIILAKAKKLRLERSLLAYGSPYFSDSCNRCCFRWVRIGRFVFVLPAPRVAQHRKYREYSAV